MKDGYYNKRFVAKKILNSIIKETRQTHQSGIYIFERTDEDGIVWFYVGQAVDIYERTLNHYLGYTQRIDVSLKKRKFKSNDNPYGWTFNILEYCSNNELNEKERAYILENMRLGKQSYNITSGSQGNDKIATKEYKEQKGYRQGLANGYEKARKEVINLFKKNLTYAISGQTNKLKERAYQKFSAFLTDN